MTSLTRYYRIDHPVGQQAMREFQADVRRLEVEAEAFAATFPDAAPVFAHTANGKRLYGLRFTPHLTNPLWTKPTATDGNVQRPRTSLPKAGIADRKAAASELAGLHRKWEARNNIKSASLHAFWEAIGTDWGRVALFGAGWKVVGDQVFVETAIDLGPCATEITGGQFAKAATQ